MVLRPSLRATARLLVLVPAASVLLYACSSTDSTPPPAPVVEGYEDVIYEGEVTDEALVALVSALEQGAKNVPANAPTLVGPMGAIPKTPVPTFTWKIGAMTGWTAPPSLLRWAEHDPDVPGKRLAGGWGELFGPVRAAYAHGTPYTGQATWAVFSSASDPKLARVLTNKTAFAPAQAVWDKIAAAGGTITLTLIGATFEENRVAADGGPFEGSVTTFTVK